MYELTPYFLRCRPVSIFNSVYSYVCIYLSQLNLEGYIPIESLRTKGKFIATVTCKTICMCLMNRTAIRYEKYKRYAINPA